MPGGVECDPRREQFVDPPHDERAAVLRRALDQARALRLQPGGGHRGLADVLPAQGDVEASEFEFDFGARQRRGGRRHS